MARTAEGAALTQQHRLRQLQLRAVTLRELLALWAGVEVTDLSETIERFARAASVAVRAGNRDSASVGAAYFTAFRDAEEVPGSSTATLVEPPVPDIVASVLRGAALGAILRARRGGQSIQAAARNGLVAVDGQASTLVLDGSRQTILRSADADPRVQRWQRITSGTPCAFCAMLASRGAVYHTDDSASFQTHDYCSCSIEPAYQGSRLPPASRRWAEQWEQARGVEGVSGTSNDALNRFRRLHEGRV